MNLDKTYAQKSELKLGLVLFKNFHTSKKWVSALTHKFINKLLNNYETYWIESQSDFEKYLQDIDFLISYEPGWSSPILNCRSTNKVFEKFSNIPSYIILSDPHSNKWREEYFNRNNFSFVLSYYFAPFLNHFKNTPLNKIIHFPWAIPDEWIQEEKIKYHINQKIICYGAVNSEAYSTRRWCMNFPFVEVGRNSGVENKLMTDEDYFNWLSGIDAAVAAGSLDKKYRLTLPKYFEIPSSGALLFAQETDDLQKLGFKHNENCIVFNDKNFESLVKSYLDDPLKYLDIRKSGKELIIIRHTQSKRLEFFHKHLLEQISFIKSRSKEKIGIQSSKPEIFTGSDEVYIANADRMDLTLRNINKLKEFENFKVDRYATVVGGLSGLNYLMILEPSEIVFFDLNMSALSYAKLIMELIQISESREDFISRIFSRSLHKFFAEFSQNDLTVNNQDQYLNLTFDKAILEGTLKKLSAEAQNTFKQYLFPFLNGKTIEGKRNCRRLLPCWPINERVPVGGGEDSGYNEYGIRVPNTNTFYYGYGWLASDNTFRAVKNNLKNAKTIFRTLDILSNDADDLFLNHYNYVIHYSNIDDWFPEKFKMRINEWSKKADNKILTLISSMNGIIYFQPDPHYYAYTSIDKYILGENLVEVTHKIPWGFHEYKRRNILIDDYISMKGLNADTTILHILYGEGCEYEKVVAAINFAVEKSKRVLLLEHNKNSTDWEKGKNLLNVKEIQQILDFAISDKKNKFVKIEFIRGINDSKRNVLFIIDSVNISYSNESALKINTVERIEDFRAYYNLNTPGVILEDDLGIVVNETDLNLRKIRDAEVLCNLAANSLSDCLDIGTYKGRSAFKLATNLNEKSEVFTVNILPEQYRGDYKLITGILNKDEIGEYYKDKNLFNIKQFFADTQTWDIPEEINNLSVVFIDGAHDTEAVYNDSKKIWDRIHPGGFIVWHDFSPELRYKYEWIDASMKGVEKFISDNKITDEIIHLKDSFMGVLQKPSDIKNKETKKIKVLITYDVKGWAWWHKAKQIQKNISENISTDILELGTSFDHSVYDYIIVFDHDRVRYLDNVPNHKIIVGVSCPVLLQDSIKRAEQNNYPAVFVNNQTMFEEIKDNKNLFLCPNGVDFEIFSPNRSKVINVGKKLIACWVGNANSMGKKGLDLIKEACSRTNISLIFIDTYAKSIPNKQLLSHQELKEQLYFKADFYINASEYEGTPNPALEALACGLPVITTRVGNMPEIIQDGLNGFFVERSIDGIVDGIEKLKKSDLKLLSINARKAIESGWSWKEKVKNYERMILELYNSNGQRNNSFVELQNSKDNAISAFYKAIKYLYEQKFDEAKRSMGFYRDNINYEKFERSDRRNPATPVLSIIIVAYNTNHELIECINSVEYRNKRDVEVIVVDNGKNECIEDNLKKLPVLYIKCPDNLILSEGRNIGAYYAKGKIIAFLDDDALVADRWIENIIHSFNRYKILGLRGKVLPKNKNAFVKSQPHYDLGNKPLFINYVDTEGNSAFLRDVYLDLNGMNPILFGGEGADLSYRISKKYGAGKFLYQPDVAIYHDYAVTAEKNIKKSQRYEVINSYLNWLYPDFGDFKSKQIERIAYTKGSSSESDSIKVLYLAFASPSYPQVMDKIHQQLSVMKQYNSESGGLVIGCGDLKKKYSYEYVNFLDYNPELDFNQFALALMDKYASKFNADIIYFRYPASNQFLYEFVQKHPNIVFEHQTKELNEYSTHKDKNEYYFNELKFGGEVLSKALGITAITNEVAEYEQKRAGSDIDYFVFGNGTWEDAAPIVKDEFPHKQINILFMGSFSPWHGFDRIIKGLSDYKGNTDFKIHVVGNGENGPEYIELIKQYKLEDNFIFHGFKSREEINIIANVCHFAIGSLGLHRIGFDQVAPLKHREYCLRGIPFIYSGNDVDFSPQLEFVHQVQADDSNIDFVQLEKFAELRKTKPSLKQDARKYALTNLTWKIKIKGIIDFLVKLKISGSSACLWYNKNNLRNPLISVVIPCYNQAEYLTEAVESVISQTYSKWECIIVNDGSNDNTSGVVKNLMKKYPDKEIKLIEKTNGGLSSARNKGVSESEGEYFVPLDADDKLHPQFIEKTLSVIEKKPQCGFVYSNIQHFGDIDNLYIQPEFDTQTLINKDNIVTVTSLVKKQVWIDNKGYNENMKEGYEDWDFWIGAVANGWDGFRINEPLFYYRKRNNSMLTNSNLKREKLIATIIHNHPDLYSRELVDEAEKKLFNRNNNFNKKILIACTHFWPSTGGVESIAEDLGSNLVEKGYKVDVATIAMKERNSMHYKGMNIISLDSSNKTQENIPNWSFELRSLVLSGDYDSCILLADPLNNIIWSLFKAKIPSNTRLIIQPIINKDGYSIWKDNIEFRKGLKSVLKNADIISMSQDGLDARFFNEENLPYSYIPNACSLKISDIDFRKNYSIPNNSILILHVANLWPVKNHLEILEEFNNMPDNWKLVMIGYPSDDTAYVNEVKAGIDKNNNVIYIPGLPKDEIADAMKSSDFIILGSKAEGVPVTILEAMSLGKPWIATPDCGSIDKNSGGIITSLTNFKTAIKFLLENPEIKNELCKVGKEQWLKTYNWDIVIKSWEQIILEGRTGYKFQLDKNITQKMENVKSQWEYFLKESIDKNKTKAEKRINQCSPLISVIIPTYNRPEKLKEAITSVLSQSYKNFELIIINDAGEDVEFIINEFNDKRINYISHKINKGLAASRNTGLKNANGKFIAYLDDDDIYYSEHLETLLRFLENSELKVAYSDAYRIIQELQDNKYVTVGKDLPYSNDFSREKLLCHNIAPVQCYMHAKDCVDDVGLFDETFKVHEDWDFWIRMSEKFVFHHIKKITSEFRQRIDKSNMTTSQIQDFYYTFRDIIAKNYNFTKNNSKIILEQLKNLQIVKNRALNVGQLNKSHESLKVSIVIPVYNKLEFTQKCLQSVYKNTSIDISFEVIVIDNASTDGTSDYLKFAENLFNSFKVITNKKNLGFSKANNQGIELAEGEYVLLLNNDTEVKKGWLKNLLTIIENDPKVGAVGSKLLYPDGTIQHAGVIIIENPKEKYSLVASHVFVDQSSDFPNANELRNYQALTGACLLIKKDIFLQAGGFDENFWNGYEDVDFCFKISELGYNIVYQPESVVIHHESKSGPERFSKVANNIQLLNKKWYGKIKADFRFDQNKQLIPLNSAKIQNYKNEYRDYKKVSIITLTYNQLEFTKSFIQSLYQNTNHPFELIIVDNNSNDNTIKFLKKLEKTKNNVKLILNKNNLGFPKGINQGIKEANSKYIIIANNDIVVTEGWLERMIEIAGNDPQVGLVGPVSNYVSGMQLDKEAKYGTAEEMHNYAAQIMIKNKGKTLEFPRVAFLCTLIKKEVIEKIGGLDERFSPGNFEDDDFCLRAQLAGFKTVIAKDVFIHHYGSKSFAAEGLEKYKARLETNQKIFVDKWGATPEEIWLQGKKIKGRNLMFTLDKNEFTENLQRALTLIEQKEYEVALDYLNNSVEQYHNFEHTDSDPELVNLLNLAGNVSLLNGKFETAKKYFENALNEDKNSSKACTGLGEVLFASNNYEAAKTMYEWGVQNDPDDKAALEGLAKINKIFNLPESDNSLSNQNEEPNLVENSNVQNQSAADRLINEAYEMFNEKRFSEALDRLSQAEKIFNGHLSNSSDAEFAASFYNMKGFNHLGLNDIDNAKACFQKALEINPNSSQAYAGLGEILLKNVDYAKIMFERAIKNNPDNIFALEKIKKIDRFLELNEELSEKSESNFSESSLKSGNKSTYRNENYIEKLESVLNEILEASYELFSLKHFEEAMDSLNKSEELFYSQNDKDLISAYENMKGFNYLGLDDKISARQCFETALNINPESSQACAGLGELFFLDGKDKEAKTMYEFAVQNNPGNLYAVCGLEKVNKILDYPGTHNTLLKYH